MVVVTAVVVVVGPYLRWRNRRALANGMRNLLILLWGAYATVYLMGLLFWMFNIFNFWTFLLVVVIVQFIRR